MFWLSATEDPKLSAAAASLAGSIRVPKGALDASGQAQASLVVPTNLPTAAIGLKLYHAYLVYDAQNNFYMASNPVTLTLVK